MKKIISVCFIISLFFDFPIDAQESKSLLSFKERDHDFGTFMESQGLVNHDFVFTNTGKVPLIINDVKASCGCTTPHWTREPVLPGKKGTIQVSFDPKARPGSFNKTIQVTSNADAQPVTLSIHGVVIPVEHMEDTYKYSAGQVRLQTIYAAFGDVYKGKTGEYAIRVMNTSADKRASLSFKQLPSHLRVTMVPEVIEPLQEGRIELAYLSENQKDWDYTVDRLDLLINGLPVPGNRISITANIKENFRDLTAEDLSKAPVAEFDHITYDFGNITPDKEVEHVFTLTNKGNSNLYIRKVGASCGCTAVKPVGPLLRLVNQQPLKPLSMRQAVKEIRKRPLL